MTPRTAPAWDAMRARVRVGAFTIGEATGKNLTFMVAKDSELGKTAPSRRTPDQ